MKKNLLYLLSFILLLLLLGAILLHPIVTPYFGRKALPEIQSAESTARQTTDSSNTFPFAELEAILLQSAQDLQVPAMSVAIGLDGEVVWANALGYADIEAGQKADTHTKFRMGSVSKSVTSMAIGKLLESGGLDLDEPIQSYLPDFDPSKPDINIRQLASHTAGIRNYQLCFCFPAHEGLSDEQYESSKESMNVFINDDLLFEPGSSFSYATYNYTVIGAAIEEITQNHILDYMADNVFTPLEMNHTMGDLSDQKVENRAVFYNVIKNKYKKAFLVNISNKWAGGGYISTPTDLVKMGNALLYDRFLAAETKAILWKPQVLDDGTMNTQNYAIGWRVDSSKRVLKDREVRIVHHGGSILGSITFLILFPEYNMSIAMMVNRSGSSSELFSPVYEMARAVIGKECCRKS